MVSCARLGLVEGLRRPTLIPRVALVSRSLLLVARSLRCGSWGLFQEGGKGVLPGPWRFPRRDAVVLRPELVCQDKEALARAVFVSGDTGGDPGLSAPPGQETRSCPASPFGEVVALRLRRRGGGRLPGPRPEADAFLLHGQRLLSGGLPHRLLGSHPHTTKGHRQRHATPQEDAQ